MVHAAPLLFITMGERESYAEMVAECGCVSDLSAELSR